MKHSRMVLRECQQGMQQHDLVRHAVALGTAVRELHGVAHQRKILNGFVLKKCEVIRFIVNLVHVLSSLRAVLLGVVAQPNRILRPGE